MVSKIPYFSIAAIGWFVLLLFGTLTPASELPDIGFNVNDKLIHLFVFFFLTILLLIAAKRENFLRISSGKFIQVVSVIVVLIGASTEVLQNYIPGRQMDLADMVANIIGVLIGVITFRLFNKG